MSRLFIVSGSLLAFLAISLGAFGSHSLSSLLDAYGKEIWEKAVFYHVVHAIALIVIGILNQVYKPIDYTYAGYAFIAGILLFSGSLYILAVSKLSILGMITPLGGLSFLAGWIFIAVQSFKIK